MLGGSCNRAKNQVINVGNSFKREKRKKKKKKQVVMIPFYQKTEGSAFFFFLHYFLLNLCRLQLFKKIIFSSRKKMGKNANKGKGGGKKYEEVFRISSYFYE